MRRLSHLMPALLFVASGCVGERPSTDTSKVVTQAADSALPVVIDTRLPAVIGIALRDNNQEARWCLHTSRADIQPNDFVKVVFAGGRRFSTATVGTPTPACVRSDTIANVRNFVLKLDSIPQYFSWFGVVIRGDVNGRLDERRGIFEAELDTLRGNDFIQDCSGARAMHLFATSGDTIGPVIWHYAYRQARSEDNPQPTCNGRFGEPLPDTTNYQEDEQPEPPGRMLVPWARQVDSSDVDQSWFALRRSGKGSELVATKVKYSSAPGVCGEETGGRSAEPEIRGDWLALLRALPGLTAGPVTSATISDSSNKYFVAPAGKTTFGDTIRIQLGGKSSAIRSEPAGKYGLRLLFDAAGKSVTLYSAKTQDEGDWSVIWAGDIDRDGDVDLLLSATRKYSVDVWYLFLSSLGKGAERWLPAAAYGETGC